MGRLHVTIPEDLHQRAKSKAALHGKTLGEYVEQAIAAQVARDDEDDRKAGRG